MFRQPIHHVARINRHYLQDSRTNLLLRSLFFVSTVPCAARATALVYYLRSGINLGPELLSVTPWASRIEVPVLLIGTTRLDRSHRQSAPASPGDSE